MANIEKTRENLEKRGFHSVYFATKQEAADYLDAKLDGKTIGLGGSMSVHALGLEERLSKHNTLFGRFNGGSAQDAATAQVYLCSVNGLSEDGELVNIDGTGNRVSATIFGHEAVYFVVGSNKIAPNYEKALWRARNIAGPKNAQRLGRKTPCAVKGDRCYDCNSPERICRALTVLWEKPGGIGEMEVVLVGEELGI